MYDAHANRVEKRNVSDTSCGEMRHLERISESHPIALCNKRKEQLESGDQVNNPSAIFNIHFNSQICTWYYNAKLDIALAYFVDV